MPSEVDRSPDEPGCPPPLRGYALLSIVCLGYIGIYLCRKNLSVAVPMLQQAWGISKQEIGVVASLSTVAYAIGKLVFGPVVDRLGGRRSLLTSMSLVALFGGLSAFAPGIASLTFLYSLNRFCGSACWGAMVKMVPEWFPAVRWSFALGLLSLSYVFGAVLALSFAGWVAGATHDNWHAVMGVPSLVLVVLVLVCFIALPRSGHPQASSSTQAAGGGVNWGRIAEVMTDRQVQVICAISFALTFMRETFNFWTVDFLKTEGGPALSSKVAALLSTPFDLCGAVGIVVLGWWFGRLDRLARRRLLFCILTALACLLAFLPELTHFGLGPVSVAIGGIGFLVYGPYSLLSGVLAVEVKGKEYAATVACMSDAVGYLAGILSGSVFGRLLMIGGYKLGFRVMAVVVLVSAGMCLLLYTRGGKPGRGSAPGQAGSHGSSA